MRDTDPRLEVPVSEIASAFVSLTPDVAGFGTKLSYGLSSQVDSSGKRLGSSFGKVFGLAAGALAAAGIGNFLKGSIEEAREAQKVGAQTEAVIKSTGAAAGITADQVGKMAGRISALTGIDDEAIQSGTNLLLTFTNIRNEVGGKFTGTLDSATSTIVDMSVALGQDMKSSAQQVGKALNDPIKGITALSRVGVTFTEQQKQQIETMVQAGNVTGAQALILGELNKEFGGSAAATATFGDKAKTVFGNLQEQLGTALLPALDAVFKLFLKAAPTISAAIDGIGPAFARVQEFIAPFVAQISAAFGGGAGGGLLAGLQSIGQAVMTTLVPVLQTAAQTFQGVVLPAVLQFGTYLASTLGPVLTQVGAVFRDQVLPIVGSLAEFFYGRLYPVLIQTGAAVAEKLQPAFEAIVSHFQTSVLPNAQKLLALFQKYQPTIEKVVLVVAKVAGKVLEFAAAIVSTVLPVALKFQAFLTGALVSAITGAASGLAKLIGWVVNAGKAFVDAVKFVAQFQRGVVEKVGQVISFMGKVPGKILNALGDVGGMLLQAGKDIMGGLARGIVAGAGAVISAIKSSVTDKLPGFVKDALGIASPSRVFAEIAKWIPEGIAKGIRDNEKKALDALQKVIDGMQVKADGLRSVADSLRSTFESISSSVASTFTGDLFANVTNSLDLRLNLSELHSRLKVFTAAANVLRGWGVSGQFISQLFASGNGALILDLASGSKADALGSSTLFGGVQAAAGSLGASVASAEVGKELRDANRELRDINKNTKALKTLAKDFERALNGAVSAGQRSAA